MTTGTQNDVAPPKYGGVSIGFRKYAKLPCVCQTRYFIRQKELQVNGYLMVSFDIGEACGYLSCGGYFMHPVSPLILVMCKTGTFKSRRDVVSHDGDVIFGRHNIHIITNRWTVKRMNYI